MRGSNGSSYFGCARNDLRSKDRSRRTVQSSQYEPNGSARVGEGRSVVRGRVLSQSLLVARERRRRELGSNLVIDTIALTSGEGHVARFGDVRRVRKILAGVPASVVIRDHILALSFSRSKRQHWTVGNRPIRKNDLRSLHRNPVEAQIQDRSRQKTGPNTAPGFLRVSNKPPLRGAKGTRAQHAGDARKPPTPPLRSSEHQDNPSIIPPPPPSFPQAPPSFPRTREPREKQSTPFPPKPTPPPSTQQPSPTPPSPPPPTTTPPPSSPVIPTTPPSFPRTREPREKQSTPIPPSPLFPLIVREFH